MESSDGDGGAAPSRDENVAAERKIRLDLAEFYRQAALYGFDV